MPIIGTPVSTGADGLQIRYPVVTLVHGASVLAKKRAISVRQGTSASLQTEIRNDQGVAVDLTDYGFADASSSSSAGAEGEATIKVRYREATLIKNGYDEEEATVISATDGVIRVPLSSGMLAIPGVYLAEIGVLDADANLLFTDECYVLVERSAWGDTTSQHGPPTLQDVRLSLRDNDPSDNLLLDHLDFDIAEISFAAVQSVLYWNDSLPPVRNAIYTTQNFRFRNIWLKGIRAHLFQIAEEHYRRNVLPYSAGGTSIDDKNKHQLYHAAWRTAMDEFQQMVRGRKAELNANNCWSSSGIGYP